MEPEICLDRSSREIFEAVGYDLYCQMLNDAIRRLSGETVREEFVTNVELPLNAYIPDSYVKNEYVKLDLYKRISNVRTARIMMPS